MLMRTKNETVTSFDNNYRFDDKPGKWDREYTYSCRCPNGACDQKRSGPWKAKSETKVQPNNTAP